MSYYDKTLKRRYTARCPQGHLYDERNTIIKPDGHPQCRECQYAGVRRRRKSE